MLDVGEVTLLSKIDEKRKNGDERFIVDNKAINNRLVEFWQWAFSSLSDNALRGSLAEYIVASALGINKLVQENWKPYDLDYNNFKVEIKSSTYIQTWQQTDYSKISFSIRKSREWLEDTSYSDEIKRQADVYVFCLLHHKDQETLNPMDLDQWTFYVVKTSVLDSVLGDMQQLSLSRLKKIEHVECGYGELRKVIDEIKVDIKKD